MAPALRNSAAADVGRPLMQIFRHPDDQFAAVVRLVQRVRDILFLFKHCGDPVEGNYRQGPAAAAPDG